MAQEKELLYRTVHRELRHMLRVHHAVCDSRVKDLGVHPSQHMLLMHLATRNEIASQKELAEHMHISPAALAVSLSKLEAGGYIEKETSGIDGRAKTLAITEKGRALVAESKRVFDAVDAEAFEGISDEALTLFIETVQKMHSNLVKMKEKEEKE